MDSRVKHGNDTFFSGLSGKYSFWLDYLKIYFWDTPFI